jgi:hypothetical protein
MKIVSKVAVSLFALALMVGFSGKALAADAAKGSIEVTVTGKDGQPAKAVEVRLMAAAAAPKAAANLAAGADRPKPIATATTDEKGVATLKDVAAGEYTVQAGGKDAGVGRANVTVKAGETVKASITLKERKPK